MPASPRPRSMPTPRGPPDRVANDGPPPPVNIAGGVEYVTDGKDKTALTEGTMVNPPIKLSAPSTSEGRTSKLKSNGGMTSGARRGR